jgi:hypothetical protein
MALISAPLAAAITPAAIAAARCRHASAIALIAAAIFASGRHCHDAAASHAAFAAARRGCHAIDDAA